MENHVRKGIFLDIKPPTLRYIWDIRSLMEGHKAPIKIFPYSTSRYIKVHGMVPHGESELLPNDFIYGNRPNVGDIKSFGSWVYI